MKQITANTIGIILIASGVLTILQINFQTQGIWRVFNFWRYRTFRLKKYKEQDKNKKLNKPRYIGWNK